MAPDPLNPDIVDGGKLTRFDRRTGQAQNIAPSLLRSAEYRVVRTMACAVLARRSKDAVLCVERHMRPRTEGSTGRQISSTSRARRGRRLRALVNTAAPRRRAPRAAA